MLLFNRGEFYELSFRMYLMLRASTLSCAPFPCVWVNACTMLSKLDI